MTVKGGIAGRAELVVSWEDTAVAVGTGDVPVLATPRVVALCEEAAVNALVGALDASRTSVSNRAELAHVAPIAVGSKVRAAALLERADGRRLVFAVTVTDDCGLVAVGKVTRVLVDRGEFLTKAR